MQGITKNPYIGFWLITKVDDLDWPWTISEATHVSSSDLSCVEILLCQHSRFSIFLSAERSILQYVIQVTYGKLNPLQIIEWMELQRLLGVELVGIYNMSIEEGPGAQVSTISLYCHFLFAKTQSASEINRLPRRLISLQLLIWRYWLGDLHCPFPPHFSPYPSPLSS